jgi:putative endonuclease
MKKLNKIVGKLGEELAAEYLVKKGYKVIERNFSTRFGEIDLICLDKDTLVFVEVKTKNGTNFGRPEEMVNRRKILKIRNMAVVYMKGVERKCRIDVVGVVIGMGREMELRQYENVDD